MPSLYQSLQERGRGEHCLKRKLIINSNYVIRLTSSGQCPLVRVMEKLKKDNARNSSKGVMIDCSQCSVAELNVVFDYILNCLLVREF